MRLFSPVTFVCFDCRRSYKARRVRAERRGLELRSVDVCPECCGPTTNMGTKFHVPPRAKVKEWARIELIVRRRVWCLIRSATTHRQAWLHAERLLRARDERVLRDARV